MNVKTKTKKDCLVCGERMLLPPCLKKRKYCSSKCFYIAHAVNMSGKNHFNYQKVKLNCVVCQKEILCSPSRKDRTKTCSLKCRYVLQEMKTPEIHPRWNGGKTVKDGYIQIHSPNHPSKNMRGYVHEHRLVMEKHIGRLLKREEVVHHIDDNRANNDITNLQLFKNNAEHLKETVHNRRK